MTHPSSAHRAVRQAGFTLVEMMVALGIGLMVSLGFAVSFVNLKATFATQDKLAQLQDNERLALAFLTASVEQAGYYPTPTSNTRDTAIAVHATADDTTYGSMAAGQSLVGMVAGTGGTPPESLSTAYASIAGDGLLTCQGGTNSAVGTTVIRNVFYVDSATHSLGCIVYANGVTTTAPGATFQPLVSNVSSMKVLYAVDTDSDGNADTYMTADVVNTHWKDVKAVQVTLNFINPNPGGATIQWVQAINLMNNR